MEKELIPRAKVVDYNQLLERVKNVNKCPSQLYSSVNVKGTVRVISSDPPFVNWLVLFTTVPSKTLSAQKCMR